MGVGFGFFDNNFNMPCSRTSFGYRACEKTKSNRIRSWRYLYALLMRCCFAVLIIACIDGMLIISEDDKFPSIIVQRAESRHSSIVSNFNSA
jgi:hypothetical protein